MGPRRALSHRIRHDLPLARRLDSHPPESRRHGQKGTAAAQRGLRATRDRRSAEPLTLRSFAFRSHHAAPARRSRRSVLGSRTISAGRWPRPHPWRGVQRPILVADRRKILPSMSFLVPASRHGRQPEIRRSQLEIVIKNSDNNNTIPLYIRNHHDD